MSSQQTEQNRLTTSSKDFSLACSDSVLLVYPSLICPSPSIHHLSICPSTHLSLIIHHASIHHLSSINHPSYIHPPIHHPSICSPIHLLIQWIFIKTLCTRNPLGNIAINKKDKVPTIYSTAASAFLKVTCLKLNFLSSFFFFLIFVSLSRTHMPNKDGMRKLENVGKLVLPCCLLSTVCLLVFFNLTLGCLSSGSLWYHSFRDTTSPRPYLIFVPFWWEGQDLHLNVPLLDSVCVLFIWTLLWVLMCKNGPRAKLESRDKRDFNWIQNEKNLDWSRKDSTLEGVYKEENGREEDSEPGWMV